MWEMSGHCYFSFFKEYDLPDTEIREKAASLLRLHTPETHGALVQSAPPRPPRSCSCRG